MPVADEPDKSAEGGSSGDSGEGSGDSGKGAERQELPSWNRSRSKKRKRKDGDDDAFQRGMKRAGRAAIGRGTLVVGGIILAAGAIGLGVFLWSTGTEESATATRVLSSAVALENRAMIGDAEALMGSVDRQPPNPIVKDEKEQDELAAQALEDLAAVSHGDTDRLGDLVRASRALRKGDHEGALALYDGFLAKAPADHPMAFTAREGRAIALEASGDLEGALSAFEGIATESGQFYRDMALYHQGRILEALDRKEAAVTIYRQYIQEFPLTEGSLAREEVKARMQELDPEGLAALGPSEPEGGVQVVGP